MIQRYNRTQIIMAVMAVIVGLLCSYLGYLFFRYIPTFIAYEIQKPLTPAQGNIAGLIGLGVLAISGYRTWKSRGGLTSYHESAFYHGLDTDIGGAYVVNHYVGRVTGPAHVLSQLFLAGPLLLLKACTNFASLIPHTQNLEIRLEQVLKALQVANKWQGFKDHPEYQKEICFLAQMNQIDFSNHNGNARFKAQKNN